MSVRSVKSESDLRARSSQTNVGVDHSDHEALSDPDGSDTPVHITRKFGDKQDEVLAGAVHYSSAEGESSPDSLNRATELVATGLLVQGEVARGESWDADHCDDEDVLPRPVHERAMSQVVSDSTSGSAQSTSEGSMLVGRPLEFDVSKVDSAYVAHLKRHYRMGSVSEFVIEFVQYAADIAKKGRPITAVGVLSDVLTSLAEQYSDDVYRNVQKGRHALMTMLQVPLSKKLARVAVHDSNGWKVAVLSFSKVYVMQGTGSSANRAKDVLGAKVIYALEALVKRCSGPASVWGDMSEAGAAFHTVVTHNVAASKRYVFSNGSEDTYASSALSHSRYGFPFIELLASDVKFDAALMFRSCARLFDRLSAPDRLSAVGRALSQLGLRSTLDPDTIDLIDRAALWVPRGYDHRAVLDLKAIRRFPRGFHDVHAAFYDWQSSERLVFINPDPKDIAFYIRLLKNDLILDRFIALDTEGTCRSGNKMPDLVQLASKNYVLVFQTNRARDLYTAAVKAILESVVVVGFSLRNDIEALITIGIEGQAADVRTMAHAETSSLYSFVYNHLHVKLNKDKAVTLSDWSVITLSDAQVLYAVGDVASLADVLLGWKLRHYETELLSRIEPFERYLGFDHPG